MRLPCAHVTRCVRWMMHSRGLRVKVFQHSTGLKRAGLVLYAALWLYALFNYRSNCVVMQQEDYLTAVCNHCDKAKKCHIDTTALGIVRVDTYYEPELSEILHVNKHVETGGWWKPEGCEPWQRVAIVIPYRDRWQHLKKLLYRLHPMLKRQQIHYHIFVIEQAGDDVFNRGKLKNIGYLEAMKAGKFDCIVLHDVDLLPEHDYNYYMCTQHARHLSHAIDEMRYELPYYSIAGGVVALSSDKMAFVNGFSNHYWGWGAEDDDLSARIQESGLMITRPPRHIGRYKMVKHKKDDNFGAYRLKNWRHRWPRDGLNDAVGMNYTVKAAIKHALYTNITVDIGSPPSNLQDIFSEGPKDSWLWDQLFHL